MNSRSYSHLVLLSGDGIREHSGTADVQGVEPSWMVCPALWPQNLLKFFSVMSMYALLNGVSSILSAQLCVGLQPKPALRLDDL